MTTTIDRPRTSKDSKQSSEPVVVGVDAHAVTHALKLALLVVGSGCSRYNTEHIQWLFSADTLTITGCNDDGTVLHSTAIRIKHGKAVPLSFCQSAKDAKAMTSKACGGGLMHLNIAATAAAGGPTHVEACWEGHKCLRDHAFSGIDYRYPRVEDAIPTNGSAAASVSGAVNSMLEFLAPSPRRRFVLAGGGAVRSLVDTVETCRSVDVSGDMTLAFDTTFPVPFLEYFDAGRVDCRLAKMDFTNDSSPVRLHVDTPDATYNCVFMAIRPRD